MRTACRGEDALTTRRRRRRNAESMRAISLLADEVGRNTHVVPPPDAEGSASDDGHTLAGAAQASMRSCLTQELGSKSLHPRCLHPTPRAGTLKIRASAETPPNPRRARTAHKMPRRTAKAWRANTVAASAVARYRRDGAPRSGSRDGAMEVRGLKQPVRLQQDAAGTMPRRQRMCRRVRVASCATVRMPSHARRHLSALNEPAGCSRPRASERPRRAQHPTRGRV
jgi:hypothetical protein